MTICMNNQKIFKNDEVKKTVIQKLMLFVGRMMLLV